MKIIIVQSWPWVIILYEHLNSCSRSWHTVHVFWLYLIINRSGASGHYSSVFRRTTIFLWQILWWLCTRAWFWLREVACQSSLYSVEEFQQYLGYIAQCALQLALLVFLLPWELDFCLQQHFGTIELVVSNWSVLCGRLSFDQSYSYRVDPWPNVPGRRWGRACSHLAGGGPRWENPGKL